MKSLLKLSIRRRQHSLQANQARRNHVFAPPAWTQSPRSRLPDLPASARARDIRRRSARLSSPTARRSRSAVISARAELLRSTTAEPSQAPAPEIKVADAASDLGGGAALMSAGPIAADLRPSTLCRAKSTLRSFSRPRRPTMRYLPPIPPFCRKVGVRMRCHLDVNR